MSLKLFSTFRQFVDANKSNENGQHNNKQQHPIKMMGGDKGRIIIEGQYLFDPSIPEQYLAPYLDQSSFLPIKLGIGLLAYLDRLKKKGFLESWESWESSINWKRRGR